MQQMTVDFVVLGSKLGCCIVLAPLCQRFSRRLFWQQADSSISSKVRTAMEAKYNHFFTHAHTWPADISNQPRWHHPIAVSLHSGHTNTGTHAQSLLILTDKEHVTFSKKISKSNITFLWMQLKSSWCLSRLHFWSFAFLAKNRGAHPPFQNSNISYKPHIKSDRAAGATGEEREWINGWG